MTQPRLPEPTVLKLVEMFHARARGQVDGLLTQIVTALQAGEDAAAMPRRVDATLDTSGFDRDEALAVAAVAVTRLAQMHHAVEQLADQWAAEAPTEPVWDGNCSALLEEKAAELRKLVDDHG
jgi:hypothetical protein